MLQVYIFMLVKHCNIIYVDVQSLGIQSSSQRMIKGVQSPSKRIRHLGSMKPFSEARIPMGTIVSRKLTMGSLDVYDM